jgi:hypothetical protein
MTESNSSIREKEISESGIYDDISVNETVYKPKCKFNIDSFTTAASVERLIDDLNNKIIKIPEFQRPYVWSKKDQKTNRHRPSLFIDSILLSLPIPPIIIYREPKADEVGFLIDGLQRLSTLKYFVEGYFDKDKKQEFRLIGDGINELWNNKTYAELSEEIRRRLMRAYISVMYIRQITPEPKLGTQEVSSVYLLFDRLNSGGISLHPHERRGVLAINNVDLIKMFKEIYAFDGWYVIFPRTIMNFEKKPENKTRIEEYIFRVYAFTLFSRNYEGNVTKFLDRFTIEYKLKETEKLEIIEATKKVLGFLSYMSGKKNKSQKKLFYPDGRFNLTFFESVFSALLSFVMKNKKKEIEEDWFNSKYRKFLKENEDIKTAKESTTNQSVVKKRLEKANQIFQ